MDEAAQMQIFTTYLQRHIQLDGDSHAQMTEDIVVSLCGSSEILWREAADAAERALGARLALWAAIAEELDSPREAGRAAGQVQKIGVLVTQGAD
jgi:hypothetical protein